MRWILMMLAAGVCVAQTEVKPETARRPPTPKEKAIELLTAVRDGVGAADPVLQPFLLWRAADTWVAIDKVKARKYLDEAFERASAMPPGLVTEPKGWLQTWIAGSMLPMDLDRATEMLRQVYIGDAKDASDPRGRLLSSVIGELMARGRTRDAVDLLRAVGARGAYPYSAVRAVFGHLAEDDPWRIILFGDAISAYQTRPSGEFGQLLAAGWKTLPSNQVSTALDSIVRQVLKYDDEQNNFQISYTMAKGVATLPTRADTELFDIIVPLRETEPAKLEEILTTHKELARTLEMMPNGFEREKVQGMSMGLANGAQNNSAFLNASTITARAMEAGKTSPTQAFELAETIPGGQKRAGCYIQLAGVLLKANEAEARRAVSKAMAALKDVKADELNGATQTWRQIVQFASDRLKEPELAREALTRSLDSVRGLYKLDANPDDPNVVPIDFWPSTRAYRDTVAAAVKLDGIGATALFDQAPDANVLLACQVAAAAELMGRQQQGLTTSIHPKRQKN